MASWKMAEMTEANDVISNISVHNTNNEHNVRNCMKQPCASVLVR